MMSVNESLVTTNDSTLAVKTPEQEALEHLNARQRKFIEAYLTNGFTGWKAAQTAGYGGENPQRESLSVIASKLLRHVHIRTIMNARLMEAAMPANKVLYKISQIADSDITEYMDDDGNVDIRAIKAAGKGFLLKRLKRKQSKKVVTREAIGEKGQVEREELETSVVHEEIDVEAYSAHEALRDLLRVYNLAGNQQVSILLTPDQVKSLTDEELDATITKLERALGRSR